MAGAEVDEHVVASGLLGYGDPLGRALSVAVDGWEAAYRSEELLTAAEGLLREVRSQEFIADTAWDSVECRRWIRKVDAFLSRRKGEKS